MILCCNRLNKTNERFLNTSTLQEIKKGYCSNCNTVLISVKSNNVNIREFKGKKALKYINNNQFQLRKIVDANKNNLKDLTYGKPNRKQQSIKTLNGCFVGFFKSELIVSML